MPEPLTLPEGVPRAGIAHHALGRTLKSMIIGGGGIALLVLSFFIPYVSGGMWLGIIMYSLSLTDLILGCFSGDYSFWALIYISPAIIGIVGGAVGLLLSSWKVSVTAGLISFITPVIFIIVVNPDGLQITWVVLTLLGGILLIISGLMMRTAASSVTRS